ncbi:hypothetical protein [Roseibium sp.]|uniref:hypothetical protein n=1 Tax=Roseibium sp. TaxID=1936156 RepID=UPI003D12D25C
MTQAISGTGCSRSVTITRSLDLIVLGILTYAVLASGVLREWAYPFGQNIYDEYFHAILDGHLDLPARVAQLEGHYSPDGVAYIYHGLAPLITRFVFGWAWPFESFSLAPLSVWIWACIGSFCYNLAFVTVAAPHLEQLGERGVRLSRYLSLATWFCSPGIYLTASTAIYHEPVVLTYAATGVFVLVWAQAVFGDWPVWRTAIPSALIAAIALHGRPNVAIGLYLATVLVLLLLAKTSLRTHWLRIGLALLILGLSGIGYLTLNTARFGSPTHTHGSFLKSNMQYGYVFWGVEKENSARASAFTEHGRFNARRIPYNFTIHMFDLPETRLDLKAPRDRLREIAQRILAPDLGFIRSAKPFVGMVWLWPLWLMFAVYAVTAQRKFWFRMAIPLAGGLATTLVTLSYGTVALRYKTDMWPLLSLLVLLGLFAFTKKVARNPGSFAPKWAAGACLVFGLFLTWSMATGFITYQTGTRYTPVWSDEQCEFFTGKKNFSREDAARICSPPRIGG